MSVISKQSVAAAASTSLFVLLWSSGAIFSKLGLAHASPFAFLLIRFAIALVGLVILVPILKLKLPRPGKPLLYAATTGLVLLGAYQIFYLLALDLNVTPGVMATIMGVQPILTAVLMERQRSWSRMFGLGLGLAGLILVVYQGMPCFWSFSYPFFVFRKHIRRDSACRSCRILYGDKHYFV